MLGNQFGHFKHVDHTLAIKNFLQVFIGIDIALVFGILQIVLLLMYSQSFLTTSDRGIGPLPTTTARSSLIVIGFINAELVGDILKLLTVKC